MNAADLGAVKGEYPPWANVLKVVIDEMTTDEWEWIAWDVSGEDAVQAEIILETIPPGRLMLYYAIKVYGNSFEPDID